MRRIFILFVVVFIVSPFMCGTAFAKSLPWQGMPDEETKLSIAQTGIVEEETTPIQNRLLKKSWRDASAEELADAFVEAVLGYQLVFDVLIKIERATGDVYKRTEIAFNSENGNHVRTVQEHGYHIREKSVYKYQGSAPVSVEIRHYDGRLTRDVYGKNPLEKDDPMYQGWFSKAMPVFLKTKKKVQDITGILFEEEVTLNQYIMDDVSIDKYKVVFMFNHQDWTDTEKTAPHYKGKVELPLNLRKVSELSFHERDRIKTNKHRPVRVEIYVGEDITSHKYTRCGKMMGALNAAEDIAQLGCLLKAVGLVNLNFSGGADYALFMLGILYDHRITQGMTEGELRQALPDVLRDKMKELQ